MTVLTMPQRSPEWFQARAGLLTASDAADIYGVRKDGKETAARRDLRIRLALERVTGRVEMDGYINADMQRGIDLEAEARAAYEMAEGAIVTEAGLCVSDELPIGASPDGFIGEDGLVELKCPRPANHWTAIVERGIPADSGYLPQLRHQLLVTGREYVDWVSYCPSMPPELQVVVYSLARDKAELPAHELAVRQFLREVDALVDEIERMRRG